MQSMSLGVIPAATRARRDASAARLTPVSPGETQKRVLIPLRWTIHSSDVSIIRDRSSLVTTFSGTWKPVARNSVRGIEPSPVAGWAGAEKISRPHPQSKGHGSRHLAGAERRRSERQAPSRRPETGAGCRQAQRFGLRDSYDVRRSHGAQRALLVECPHRCRRERHGGVEGLRRSGARHHYSSRLLVAQPPRSTPEIPWYA